MNTKDPQMPPPNASFHDERRQCRTAFVTGVYLHLSRAFLADAPAWLPGSDFDAVITDLRAMCMGEALDNRAARDATGSDSQQAAAHDRISPVPRSNDAGSRKNSATCPQRLWTTPLVDLEVA